MRYLLLIYSAPGAGPEPGSPEHDAEMQEWFAYTEALREAGVLLGGEPLHGIETAVTVRGGDAQTTRTDGPFAETKEVLGGFYMIDVDDVDAAVAWAEKLPSTKYGSTEVRPIMELG
ncbi:MAG: YciI family protein [Acidimicrobiia bacterium]|nr:YciI family protein [Acidimicrobiia bacterium]